MDISGALHRVSPLGHLHNGQEFPQRSPVRLHAVSPKRERLFLPSVVPQFFVETTILTVENNRANLAVRTNEVDVDGNPPFTAAILERQLE
jgi:hypothetical protein